MFSNLTGNVHVFFIIFFTIVFFIVLSSNQKIANTLQETANINTGLKKSSTLDGLESSLSEMNDLDTTSHSSKVVPKNSPETLNISTEPVKVSPKSNFMVNGIEIENDDGLSSTNISIYDSADELDYPPKPLVSLKRASAVDDLNRIESFTEIHKEQVDEEEVVASLDNVQDTLSAQMDETTEEIEVDIKKQGGSYGLSIMVCSNL